MGPASVNTTAALPLNRKKRRGEGENKENKPNSMGKKKKGGGEPLTISRAKVNE